MRKFKLIKTYPNSEPLDTIFLFEDNDTHTFIEKEDGTTAVYGSLTVGYFTNNEYFEEVIEKDYEILSFYDKKSNKVEWHKNDNDDYYSHLSYKEYSINQLLNKYSIHSIKRLLDGEVFTVGDKIEGYNNTGIKEIKLFEYGLRVITDANGKGVVADKLAWDLKSCKKAKTPLFTTEDGVDIYEGDKMFCLEKGRYVILSLNTMSNAFRKAKENYHFFSTQEAAEEYVLINKPCLSYWDIFHLIPSKYKSELKMIVKSKL